MATMLLCIQVMRSARSAVVGGSASSEPISIATDPSARFAFRASRRRRQEMLVLPFILATSALSSNVGHRHQDRGSAACVKSHAQIASITDPQEYEAVLENAAREEQLVCVKFAS